jgi:hypothetical protein
MLAKKDPYHDEKKLNKRFLKILEQINNMINNF